MEESAEPTPEKFAIVSIVPTSPKLRYAVLDGAFRPGISRLVWSVGTGTFSFASGSEFVVVFDAAGAMGAGTLGVLTFPFIADPEPRSRYEVSVGAGKTETLAFRATGLRPRTISLADPVTDAIVRASLPPS